MRLDLYRPSHSEPLRCSIRLTYRVCLPATHRVCLPATRFMSLPRLSGSTLERPSEPKANGLTALLAFMTPMPATHRAFLESAAEPG